MRRTCIAIILGVGLVLSGCAQSGYSRASLTSDSLANTRTELLQGRAQINRMMTSLHKLESTRQGDLKPLYDDFVHEVDMTETRADAVRGEIDQLTSRRDNYFNAWAAQTEEIQNPTIKAKSTRRQKESRKSFQQLTGTMELAEKSYHPLMSDLRDLETALAHDLNPRGVASVSRSINKAKRQASMAQSKIDRTINELDRVERELSSRASL